MSKDAAETPGSLNSGNITRRLSTGSCDIGDNARRNSSENLDSVNIIKRRIPHYLRASTGSCHDICKYGRGHAFEDKAMVPLRKKAAKPSLNEVNSIEIIVPGAQRKGRVKQKPSLDARKHSLLLKPSSDVKSLLSNVKASSEAKAHSRKLNGSSSGKTLSPNSPTKKPTSPETPKIIRREILFPQDSVDNKMSKAETKTLDQLVKQPSYVESKPVKVKSSDGVHGIGRRKGDVHIGRKMRASASANKPAAASLFPKSSLSKTASNKARQSEVKSLSLGKDQHRIDKVETETSNGQVSETTLHFIKIGTGNNPSEYVPDNHGFPALASPSSPVSLSHANPSMADEGINYSGNETDVASDDTTAMELGNVEPVKENHNKTLRIETENAISKSTHDIHVTPALPSPSSFKSLSHRKSPSILSLEEEDEEIKHIDMEADKLVSGKKITVKISKATPKPVTGNLKKNLRKIRVVSSGDKYCKPVKLKFRRGKVLDLDQSNNNNIPRRLRYRRITVRGNEADTTVSHKKKSLEIGNNQPVKEIDKTSRKSRVVVSENKCRSSPMRLFGSEKGVRLQPDNNIPWRLGFRRARINGVEEGKGDSKRNIKNGGAAAGAKLKHQDLQGKKDAQCLFNKVIEETATKLVESRKSKVKALVGAFETVISLQECKPSSHTAT